MKKLTLALLAFIPVFANAQSGWTTNPGNGGGGITAVEVVRAQGFFINGNLGNPAGCSNSDTLWIAIDHPQYDILYSTVLAAYMSGKKIQAYAHQCGSFGWHGGSHNQVTGDGALYIRN